MDKDEQKGKLVENVVAKCGALDLVKAILTIHVFCWLNKLIINVS